jgi:hypothetical protein
MTIIHVNRQFIAMNAKDGGDRPVFTLKQGGKTTYARGVKIQGPSHLVSPGTKLKCGAREWIVTESPVELEDPMSFSDVKKRWGAMMPVDLSRLRTAGADIRNGAAFARDAALAETVSPCAATSAMRLSCRLFDTADALPDLIAEVRELRAVRDEIARLREENRYAGNLLAVMHGDGGHYISDHGWAKACKDAEQIRHDYKQEIERLRAIIGKLPVTADGVSIVPGQTYVIETGKGVLFEQVLDIDAQGLVARTCYGSRPIEFWDDYEGASIVPAQVWSNTKAAEAARRNEENNE